MPNLKHIAVNGVTYDIPTGGVKVITYSAADNWQCDGASITTKLAVNDIIVYNSPSNPSIIKLKNGNSYLTKLNLISNSKNTMGNATGLEYISLYCGFFCAYVTKVTTSRVTAKVIATDTHGYRKASYDSSYNATKVEEHPYKLGNIILEKAISSDTYYPFTIKTSASTPVELTPTSVTLYVYDDNSYVLKYLFNLESNTSGAVYTRNSTKAYDLFMYMTNPMYASSTYAASSNNHELYLKNGIYTVDTKLNIGGSSDYLNMASGDAALFIYGMFPANCVYNTTYY